MDAAVVVVVVVCCLFSEVRPDGMEGWRDGGRDERKGKKHKISDNVQTTSTTCQKKT